MDGGQPWWEDAYLHPRRKRQRPFVRGGRGDVSRHHGSKGGAESHSRHRVAVRGACLVPCDKAGERATPSRHPFQRGPR